MIVFHSFPFSYGECLIKIIIFCHPFMDVMYNYSKAKIKSSLEIDKIMKKLENTYQDASLIKKALLGDASDKEQQVLEQRLSMHPELKAVYEKLQDSEELKDAFNKYKEYSSEKAYEHFLQQIQQKRIRPVERFVVSGHGGMLPQQW